MQNPIFKFLKNPLGYLSFFDGLGVNFLTPVGNQDKKMGGKAPQILTG